MELEWNDFKNVVDEREMSIQRVTVKDNYWLKAIDGFFSVECIIPTDEENPSTAEFLADYQDRVNKTIQMNVVQVLGKDAISLSPRTSRYVGTKNQEVTWDKVLDQTMVVRGGVLFVENACFGDTFKLSVIDKDDVLGYGGTPEDPIVLGDYVKEWSVMPGVKNELVDVSISQPLPAGVYFRMSYGSDAAATEDPKIIVNLIAYGWSAS